MPNGSADHALAGSVPAEEEVLARAFYQRDPRVVAPELLNKVLVYGGRAGRLVEVEAYCGAEDPASHSYGGMTRRNQVMFGPPGGLYVYFTYGMHWCVNAVCGEPGVGVAVLLRAAAPLRGVDEMWAARPAARRTRDLCSGPAKLAQAFGLDGSFNGVDLVIGDGGVVICDDGLPPPSAPGQSTRVGVNAGSDHPWRWYVSDDPNVSRR
jgi:DNA-3-methyladenine glycosylase